MYSGMRAMGWEAVFYFLALVVLGMFILLNLFMAILLSNFDELAACNHKVRRRLRPSPALANFMQCPSHSRHASACTDERQHADTAPPPRKRSHLVAKSPHPPPLAMLSLLQDPESKLNKHRKSWTARRIEQARRISMAEEDSVATISAAIHTAQTRDSRRRSGQRASFVMNGVSLSYSLCSSLHGHSKHCTSRRFP